jgi:hypothetical protein
VVHGAFARMTKSQRVGLLIILTLFVVYVWLRIQ